MEEIKKTAESVKDQTSYSECHSKRVKQFANKSTSKPPKTSAKSGKDSRGPRPSGKDEPVAVDRHAILPFLPPPTLNSNWKISVDTSNRRFLIGHKLFGRISRSWPLAGWRSACNQILKYAWENHEECSEDK